MYRFLKVGLKTKVIDFAGDVGGTWYWNHYPGAMSDSESYVYRFFWDKEDLQTYPWSHRYVKQPEILAYLKHVVKRHNLRKHMQFNTELVSASWDEQRAVWRVEVKALHERQSFDARYLVTALGLLTSQKYPDIPGISDFKGIKVHTGAWSDDIDLRDKQVGIIGNGSSGVQVITEIAGKVKSLTSFQRRPQYTVPSGDGPVTEEYRKQINARYDEVERTLKDSIFAFGYKESTQLYDSVSEREREQIFENLWQQGNGFRFLTAGFCDLLTNRAANQGAVNFMRKKIRQIVKDPEKARKLTSYDLYANRPLCDGGYYEQFNRDNVDIVDLKDTPITGFTERGILTSDGKEYEFDVVIFATGFDAVDGSYNRIDIRGVGGRTLKEHWKDGPSSYLGLAVPGFPNLFMITGPLAPFANLPPIIELTVDFIILLVEHAEKNRQAGRRATIEATTEAEIGWKRRCEQLVENNLMKEAESWIFGANIEGKPLGVRFYFGGFKGFEEVLDEVKRTRFGGFKAIDVERAIHSRI